MLQQETNKKKYKFSRLSLYHLQSCHYDLQELVKHTMAEQVMDFSVLCGHRTKEVQNKAYSRGYSRLMWPKSRHNDLPSYAVDLAAYPITNFDADNTKRTKELAQLVLKNAKELKIDIIWGGNWKHFEDIYHFELPEDWPNIGIPAREVK